VEIVYKWSVLAQISLVGGRWEQTNSFPSLQPSTLIMEVRILERKSDWRRGEKEMKLRAIFGAKPKL